MSRHAWRPTPRGHWLLLSLLLPVVVIALLFEGWTTHEIDAARKKPPCTAPVPASVDNGDPVLRPVHGGLGTASMPRGTAALTFDGGPDPVWTPRLLGLLRRHGVHATFFLTGSKAARHPELVRRIRDAGHEIGSYTYTGGALGSASRLRFRLELTLTQSALAAADVNTRLLRLPQTTAADTLCGGEWTAVRRAAAQGYVVVAADHRSRKAAAGVVRQYASTDLGYREAERLLNNPRVEEYATVSDGLGLPPAVDGVPVVQRLEGRGLIWVQAAGRAFTHFMVWALAAAGALGVLRLVLLALFARAHARRRDAERAVPRWPPGASGAMAARVPDAVTVLVPAYNEEEGIASTLDALLSTAYPYLQVVVVDDGSTDRTAEIAESFAEPRLTVVRQPNAGKARALNTGLAYAHHGIVVMIDADTSVEPGAIRDLVRPFADPSVGAVSGNTKVANRRGLLGRWQHLEYILGFNLDRRMFAVLQCMPTVPGAIGAFRRAALLDVGGVSEDTLAEDTDLTMALWRAGWRVEYEETAIAWTEVPHTLRQLWRQRYRWCYGTLQAMWKHRRTLVMTGSAGRFGRRGLSYLALFQVLLPLLAPVVDVFALYAMCFRDPLGAAAVWGGFLAVQLVTAGYALRLDRERLRALWSLPLQSFVYRQLLYLVVVQSVVTAMLGVRLKWQRIGRAGAATAARDGTAAVREGTAAARDGNPAGAARPVTVTVSGDAPPRRGRTAPEPAGRTPDAVVPRRRRSRFVRRVVWPAAVLLTALLTTAAGAGLWAQHRLDRSVDLDTAAHRPPPGAGTTYLIVGSDSREGLSVADQDRLHTGSVAGRRTDSMMLLHTGARGTTLVSLPRDSWVTLPAFTRPTTGKRFEPAKNKLNAAFSLGGPELLARTVEKSTGLHIDHYAEIGIGGFADVVDSVGGVRMCLDRPIRDEKSGAALRKGCQILDGAQSLAYVRQRHQESDGDLGRIRNQRKFLAALSRRAVEPRTLLDPTRLYPVAAAGLDALVVDEDMGLRDLAEMFRAVRAVADGRGRQLSVPVSAVGIATKKGSAILWDEDGARRLFARLRE